MITKQPLYELCEFENLKEGQFVACEFHRNVGPSEERVRFGVYKIYKNKSRTKEIILQKENNIYFNYEMYVNGESNLKSIELIGSICL